MIRFTKIIPKYNFSILTPLNTEIKHPLVSYKSKSLLFILPAVYGLLSFIFWRQSGSFFTSYPDRIYVYLIASLDIANGGFDVGVFQHPGTPVQWIGGLTLFITHFLKGNTPLYASVLSDPEYYLRVCATVITALVVLSVYFGGKLIVKHTGNIVAALLLQLVPISSYLAIQCLNIQCECGFLIVLPYYCAFLWVLCYKRDKFPSSTFNTNNSLIVFAFFTALLITIKITCLPFVIVPLFFIRTTFYKIIYFTIMVVFCGLILYPIWSSFSQLLYWVNAIATHSGAYGSGKLEVVNTTSLLNNLQAIFTTELFFTIGYFLISTAVVVGLVQRKWDNHFYKLSLAFWLVITVQIVLTIKHYSYHYIIPSQLLIIPGVLAGYKSISPFKSTRTIQYLFLFVCCTWLLSKSVMSATIFKNGNVMYNSSIKAKRHNGLPKIITTSYQESCFIESALHYSASYAGKQSHPYFYHLRDRYPNSYFYSMTANTFKWFEMNISVAELFRKHPRILIYFPNMDEFTERDMIKKLIAENDSVIQSVSMYDYNNETGERFFMLNVDTAKANPKYTKQTTIFCDFEKKRNDNSEFMSSDPTYSFSGNQLSSNEQKFSGNSSIKLSQDQYACNRTFPVNPGDAIDISVKFYSPDRPGGLSLVASNATVFDKTTESYDYDYGNGWRRLHRSAIIPANYPEKEIRFCLFYYGTKKCYFDDLNIVLSKK